MWKCNIRGCPREVEYSHDWEQGKKKFELNLCVYCYYQLLGEMLKQQMLEKMIDALGIEDASSGGKE